MADTPGILFGIIARPKKKYTGTLQSPR